MSKYLLLLFLIFASSSTLYSQNDFIAIISDHETNEPIAEVTVAFPELGIGSFTDSNGFAEVKNIPDGTHQITISFVGYETITITRDFPLDPEFQNQTFELHHAHEELDEITITSTRSSRTIEDIPTRVEFIAGEELAEKGNMKPGDIRMLLNESTGIQTQQTSATSYNSSIRIQGLDGRYTQLLRDGLPLYSGFSGGLSLMQIAPLDLKQVEVIKGASSTLYGEGAIAGLVNLISKTPGEDPELSFMLNETSARGIDLSGFYSSQRNAIGTTVFASYNKGTAYDPADIGFTAIPEFERFTLNPKIFVDLNPNTSLNAGFNVITENRLGGDIDFIEGENVNNPYLEENETQRISTQFQLTHQFSSDLAFSLKNSLNYYDRSISIPDYTFSGLQSSSFSEANISLIKDKTEWIGGLNLWTDNFDEARDADGFDLSFSDVTIGGFAQNTWICRYKPLQN